LGRTIKILWFDNGGEFHSTEFCYFCKKNGFNANKQLLSPQWNGVVERRNYTVVEIVGCMLESKSMPNFFWVEVVNNAMYLLNIYPTKHCRMWHLKGLGPKGSLR
jgi:hypothetical protein